MGQQLTRAASDACEVGAELKPGQRFASVPQVATLCGVSHSTVWRWIKRGSLKAKQFSPGCTRIDLQQFEQQEAERNGRRAVTA